MCNIAGYVGPRSAASVLIDMIKKQEGFNGGYYTGIATMHNGRIYYAKLTGDAQRLIDQTDAQSLPGNIGIIHSRTKSGGGDGWAHPFVACSNDLVKTAYVANGSAGFFKNRIADAAVLAQKLEHDGYSVNCRLFGVKNASYPTLDDGSCLHMSDVMCQLFQRNMDKCGDPVLSIAEAYAEMPGEIVGLLLNLSMPDAIVWSRISKPMFVGFGKDGAYLASCPIAFPDGCTEPKLLPPCSSGAVYADHYTTMSYEEPPARVADLDHRILETAYFSISGALVNGEKSFNDLLKLVRSLGDWQDGADCLPDAPVVYQVLYELYKNNSLKMRNVEVDGVQNGILAPRTLFRL